MSELPKYTKNKKQGNIGEALVQYILSDFCLVHKIDGSNDIGNDFICELIKDESPTNLLFYVQVKYTKRKPRIKDETLEYWKTSPIPVYLFWIKDKKLDSNYDNKKCDFKNFEKKYSQCTPVVHESTFANNDILKKVSFNFKNFEKRSFLKDLISDYCRTQYQKGSTPVVEPRDFLTLQDKLDLEVPRYQLLVDEVIPEYKKIIIKNGWANLLSIAISLNAEDYQNKQVIKNILELSKILLEKDYRDNSDYRGVIELLISKFNI